MLTMLVHSNIYMDVVNYPMHKLDSVLVMKLLNTLSGPIYTHY